MEELLSVHKGYTPVDSETLFASLIQVTAILDDLGIPYILTGGTLLGAVREGDMLPGDSDWDLEILDTDVANILANAEKFAEHGLTLDHPLGAPARPFDHDGDSLFDIERRIIKIRDTEDRFHGDLFVQTLFSDGMLRRMNIENATYFNAKMTFPYWFFENRAPVQLRGHTFTAPAEPEMMLERIYGPNWRIPIGRHDEEMPTGYNFAGAHMNAKAEKGMAFALDQGWVPHYPDAPQWPMKIKYTANRGSKYWVTRHEHLEATPDGLPMQEQFTLHENNARLVLYYRIWMTELKRRTLRQKTQLRAGQEEKKQTLSRLKRLDAACKKQTRKLDENARAIEKNTRALADMREKSAQLKKELKATKATLKRIKSNPVFRAASFLRRTVRRLMPKR